MAVNQGPQISRTGLVAHYDVSNEKSFRGLTATNLMYGAIYRNLGDTAFYKSSSGTESVFIPYFNQLVNVTYVDIYNDYNASIAQYGSQYCCPNPFQLFSTNIAVTGSTTYMYQLIFKTDTGYYHPNYMYRYEFNSGGTTLIEGGLVDSSRLESLGDGWYHAWGSFTTNANTTQMTAWLFHYEYATWNRIRVAAVCLTQGSVVHRPEHILNLGYRASRGTTVASGGGLRDLINTNHLDLYNGVSFADGGGGSLVFDGTNDYAQANQSCGITDDITLEAWIKSTSSGGTHRTIISTDISYRYGVKFMCYKNYDRWGLWLGFGTSDIEAFNTTININDSQNHHVVASWTKSTGVVRLYLDGTLTNTISSGSTQSIALNNGSISLATDYHGGSYFAGNIYLAKVYNRVLTDAEVLTNYRSTKSKIPASSNRNIIWSKTNLDTRNTLNTSLVLFLDPANRDSFIPGSLYWYDLSPNRRVIRIYAGGGGNFNLTAPGTIGFSNEGKGTLVFDGVNDWGYPSASITTASNYTVSAWVKTGVGGDRGIFSHCSGGPVGLAYSIENYMKYWYYSGQWYTTTSYALITDGIWKHIVWVKSGTNMKMYINGILDREVTLVADVISTMRSIGSRWGPCGTSTGYAAGTDSYGSVFSGSMGPMTVWSRALAPTEVTTFWNTYRARFSMNNIITDGLVLHLSGFDRNSYSGSGTTWTDLSGNGYNGTLTNGPTFNTTGGGSIVFDGVDDFVSLPINSAFNTPSVTYEVWANLQTINDRHILLVNWSGNALEVNSNRSVVMYSFSSGGQLGALTSAGVFEWDTWCHFLGTYDTNSQTLRTYVNGVLLATATNISSTIYNVSVHKISGTDYGGEVKGRVAAVRHYNRALSAAEILQNFNVDRWRFGV